MLYETCARTEELLQLNIEDLHLSGRCAQMKSKGAKPRTRRRGPALARLPYDQARHLLDAATAVAGPGTGWDLHELRHSGLTHLGESGASLLELMAKSRHRKAENLRRYFKPSQQAMRELTSILGPGNRTPTLTSSYAISVGFSAVTTGTPQPIIL
jgi:site-specific recombinase XerD